AAGLAVVELRAVERLGQDAGAGRLARAPRAAEQIGVGGAVVAHRIAQGPGDVVLRHHLAEALRPVTAVEGLVGGHASPTLARGGDKPARRSTRRPGDLRHTGRTAESCCLPALTRFPESRCAGPGR